MATLSDGSNTVTLDDNSDIKDACKELGVVFGCEDGLCGTCLIEIDEGSENMTEPTQAEKDMGMEDNNRLACQCNIKIGHVKIIY